MNVVLIGMPTSGKSTVGVLVAKALGYGFLDTDLLIQRRERRKLSEILAERGIAEFNRIENEVNASVEAEDCVIAPGGSAVYGAEAMAHFRQIGRIVYLRLPYEEIAARLSDPSARGVVMREGETLKELYDERVPLYERYADLTVDCAGKTMEQIVGLVLAALA